MQEKAFFKAVKDGDLILVEQRLAEDPNLVHARDQDMSTPLHWAAWKGHPTIIHTLIDSGADIHAHNENSHWGTTPLHAAAHGNRKDAAVALLRRGADPNILKSNGTGTPLQETAVHNANAVAKILRSAGATG